jgi:hypothetical protein
MHRHVIAHGDHFTTGIKDRAGVIAPFLDVGRKRGATQRRSHLLCDGVIDVLEDFQFDGIASHCERHYRGAGAAWFQQALPVYANFQPAPGKGISEAEFS